MARRREESGGGDLSALVLRGALGSLMAGHGSQKGFGWFEGPGPEGTSGFMEMLGLKPGRPWANLAIASELGGGALTALGLLNPLGPVGIIGSMAMAWTEGGAELPLTNIAAALALMISGPGKYSLDRAFGIRLPRWVGPLGLAAVLLTVLYAANINEEASDEDEAREELAGEED
jgi:putative oxidoreductase